MHDTRRCRNRDERPSGEGISRQTKRCGDWIAFDVAIITTFVEACTPREVAVPRNSQPSIAKALTTRFVTNALMRRALTVFLAILLTALTAACSSIVPGADTQITAAPAEPPVNYRKIILAKLPNNLTDGAQASELRKAVAPQLFDWVACLKLDTKPNISLFAVFFEGEKIEHFRRSVLIDQCESADYSPLTPPAALPAPAKKTQLKHKKDNTKLNATRGLVPTPEERASCLPDVEKFCPGATSVDQAFACLQANRSRISIPCNRVVASHSQ